MSPRYRLDTALSGRAASRLERGFEAAGWTLTEGDDWDLDWIQGPPGEGAFVDLSRDRAINHFPGFAAFGHKGYLHRNLTAAREWTGPEGDYDFHPQSFSLPDDLDEWRTAATAHPERVWIVKPPRGGQGQGISLLTDPALAPTEGEWVVQEYIDRPHLIDDRKYVLRVWLVVTSLDPLVCYMHTNGVFKMTARPFRSARNSADDLPTHLTNPSVQSAERDVPLGSLNSDLHGFRTRLNRLGIDPEPIFDRVRDAMIQSVIACRDQALELGRGAGDLDGCFELLGPDILIDEDLKPWVLELNTFPSLEVSHEAEPEAAAVVRAAKDELIADLARLLRFDSSEPPARAGGFERIWPASDASRFAGCFPLMRPDDRRLANRFCVAVRPSPPPLRVVEVNVHPVGDGIALIRDGEPFMLNQIGAAVWLCLDDGLTAEETIEELSAVFPDEPRDRIRSDVWHLLSNWVRAGLVVVDQDVSPPGEQPPGSPATPEKEGLHGARHIQQARPA